MTSTQSSGVHAAHWRAFAAWGATRLPKWWLRSSPGPIGVGVGLAQPRVVQAVRRNLRLVRGARAPWVEASDVVETLANFGHCLAEGLAAGGDRPPDFRYEIENADVILRARDAAKGAIMVTAHVGAWEVAGGMMIKRGFKAAIAMAKERDDRAQAISDAARMRHGLRIFHVGDDPLSVLPLVRHVRDGGAIALQIDRVPRGIRGIETRLFGVPWAIPAGPFQLARLTGAPIIPIFSARIGFARYLLHAGASFELGRRASDRDVERAADRATRSMEGFIARFPTQWFHFV